MSRQARERTRPFGCVSPSKRELRVKRTAAPSRKVGASRNPTSSTKRWKLTSASSTVGEHLGYTPGPGYAPRLPGATGLVGFFVDTVELPQPARMRWRRCRGWSSQHSSLAPPQCATSAGASAVRSRHGGCGRRRATLVPCRAGRRGHAAGARAAWPGRRAGRARGRMPGARLRVGRRGYRWTAPRACCCVNEPLHGASGRYARTGTAVRRAPSLHALQAASAVPSARYWRCCSHACFFQRCSRSVGSAAASPTSSLTTRATFKAIASKPFRDGIAGHASRPACQIQAGNSLRSTISCSAVK